MKVLVTGATGFVGNAAAHRLVDEGHSIRCLVRKTSDTRNLSDIVWEKIVGDITQIEDCREAVRGMEVVVHCAAHVTDFGPWKTFRKINVAGSLNLAEAALGNKVRNFIYFSTSDVLGVITDRKIDDTMPYQKSGFPYPDTKIEAETKLFELFRKRSLPLVALRPTWVYGPGDLTFIPEIVDAMSQGIMFYLGSRNNSISTIYIDNLMDALVLSLEKEEAIGRAYIVDDGIEFTWEQLCLGLADGLGLSPPKVTIPKMISQGLALSLETLWSVARSKSRPLLTRYNVAFLGQCLRYDSGRIREELGFNPRVLPEEGLEKTIKWLKSQPIGKLKRK